MSEAVSAGEVSVEDGRTWRCRGTRARSRFARTVLPGGLVTLRTGHRSELHVGSGDRPHARRAKPRAHQHAVTSRAQFNDWALRSSPAGLCVDGRPLRNQPYCFWFQYPLPGWGHGT